MTTGTGIALAAIWLVPVAAFSSRDVTGYGTWVAIGVAIVGTLIVR